MSELKNKTVKGVFWSAMERFSVQGIQFVVMIVMARLLLPSDYGLIGMLTIFLAISQSLIDSGFSQALIRKQNRTEADNSTVFYFNIAVSLTLYLILFVSAPFIADFYKTPELSLITRVLCLGIIINSLAVVQRAIYTATLNFKTQAKASFSAAVLSGFVGISMAYLGYGVWALVAQQLVSLGTNTILLWIFSSWKPKRIFSTASFKELFGFGSKLLLSGLLETTYNNIYPIVIGKCFSSTTLGFYTRSQQFADFPSSNITGILQRVTFPVLCTVNQDQEKLASTYRKLLKISAYIIFPLMMGLAGVSHPMVLILLKEKWEFVATLLIIICFAKMWYPVHAINLNVLTVSGRSDLFLRLEIFKKMIGISIMCITVPMGIIAMCFGLIVSSLLYLVVNIYYTGKLIHVGFLMQMKDLLPTFMLSVSMGVVVYSISFITPNLWVQLIGGIFIGFAYYFIGSKVFAFSEMKELLSIIKR